MMEEGGLRLLICEIQRDRGNTNGGGGQLC